MRTFLNFRLVALATSAALSVAAPAQAQGLDEYETPTEEQIGKPPEPEPEPPPKSAAERPPEEEDKPEPEEVEISAREEYLRRAQRKLRLGLRGGYGVPLGDIQKDVSLSNNVSDPVPYGVSGLIPIWLDFGYMAFPKILLGVYARYGVAFFLDCPRCSGRDIRFGLQVQYHFVPDKKFDPWLGIGFGYEFLNTKERESQNGKDSTFSAHGFEFANLQAGLDIELAEVFSIGPFVSFSLGQYSGVAVQLPGAAEVSDDIGDSALHMWLEPGVKGTFRF